MVDQLTLRLDYRDPLELTALSKSLTRIGRRYARFSRADDLPEATLVIEQIRQNCLIIDLAPLAIAAGGVMSAAEPVKNAVEFALNLKTLLEFFLGRGPRPKTLTKMDCDDAREIVQPIAIQREGQFQISASGDATVSVNINLNSVEANAVQNRAEQEKIRLRESTSRIEKGVAFYWQVADKSAAVSEGRTPDRGVIEKVDKRDRPIRFEDPILKSNMMGAHPFETAYIVDAEVIILKDAIQAYKILAVHDSFPLED